MITNKSFLYFLILLLIPISSYCDDIKKWELIADSLYANGIEEYKNKQFEKACGYFKQVSIINDSIERKEPFFSSNSEHWEAASLYNLGDTLSAYELSNEYMLIPVDQRKTVISDSLWSVSEEAFEHENYDLAISLAKKAIEKEEAVLGDNHYYVANSYVSLSTMYIKIDLIEEAKVLLLKAIKIFEQLGYPITDNCVEAIIAYHDILHQINKSENADSLSEIINGVLPYNKLPRNSQIQAIVSKTLSGLYYKNEEFYKAYSLILDGISALESLGKVDMLLYAECVHNAGMYALQAFNDSILFSEYMRKAILLKEQLIGKSFDYFWSVQCYADGYYYMAQKEEYPHNIKSLEKALSLYETIPNYGLIDNYRTTLNRLSVSYEHINIMRSVELGEKLLSVERKYAVGDTLVALSNLASFYTDYDNDKALQCAKIVLNAAYKNSSSPNYDRIYFAYRRLAAILCRARKFDEAISYSKKSLLLADSLYGTSSKEYAISLQNLAVYYDMKGDKINSLYYMRKAYFSPYGDRSANANNLAGLYSSFNLPDSCYKYIKEAWEINRLKFIHDINNLTKENRLSYIYTEYNYCCNILPILYMLSNTNNSDLIRLAFDCALFTKDILRQCMNDDLEEASFSKNNFESVKSSLNNGEIAIEVWENKWNKAKEDDMLAFIIRQEYDTPLLVKLSKEKISKTFSNEIPTTETSLPLYDNIWKELIETAQIQEGERVFVSLDGILTNAPIESIMGYDYEYMGDKYDIIRLTSTSEIPRLRDSDPINSVVLYGGLKYDSDAKTIMNGSFAIYDGKRSIDENLFEEMSDSVYSELRSSAKYLPWSKMEVDTVKHIMEKSLVTADVRVFMGDDGIEETFKSLSGNSPSIIHVATHGFVGCSEEIMSSWELYKYFMENTGLLFSGVLNTDCINSDSLIVEDGILRSSEISMLDLSNTKLLVLSACETGNGGLLPLGVIGLVRAFKAAGVGSIIMTTGKVDDSACFTMMSKFYEYLMAGHSKREAFKMAQKFLRETEEYHDFAYWGSFVMID